MTDLTDLRRDALFDLLPAIYRQKDAERRTSDEALGPLRALYGVLAGEMGLVEDDILQLLDNWFIETCDEWTVPYIGDLLGVRGLQDIVAPGFSRRALVANTLGFRRAKGVPRVIEQLAQDATGWRALAREEFTHLNGTQNVNHLRPAAINTPDLRDSAQFEDPQGPFDRNCHLVDIRSIELGRGRFNIPNISLFLWRLQAYRVRHAELTPEGGVGDGYALGWTAGQDMPIFNPPRTDTGTQDRTDPRAVPAPLQRRELFDELNARRAALAAGQALPRYWFDDGPNATSDPVFTLELDGAEVPPEQVMVCDLSSWRQPPDSLSYDVTQADGSVLTVPLPILAAVDPELGRLRLAPGASGAVPRLTHSYGFPGDLGPEPFSRRAHLETLLEDDGRDIGFSAGVSRRAISPSDDIFATLTDAITAWNAQPAGTFGMIAIMDSGRYAEDLTAASRIEIPEGSRLLIIAADWPAIQDPDAPPGVLIRPAGQIDPSGVRPHLIGDVGILGTAPAQSETPGELWIDGLLIDGAVEIEDGHLGGLKLSHSSVAPSAAGLSVPLGNAELAIELMRSICGPVTIGEAIRSLRVVDCILDGQQNANRAVQAPQTLLEICASTTFGTVSCQQIEASGAIFGDPVNVEQLQSGCVRYCWVEPGSSTPRRYRCQPNLALRGVAAPDEPAIIARIRPAFTSQSFGAPSYAQLAVTCAPEICQGGEDGNEMGAWQFLRQPFRRANLRSLMPDYLPYGLAAGVFFET